MANRNLRSQPLVLLLGYFLLIAVLIIAAQQTASAEQISLRNTSSNLFLDVVGAQTNNGQPVILFDFNGNRNQLFDQTRVQVGFELVARHSGKCLDVAGASRENFAPVIQFDCHRGNNQLWLFEHIGRPPSECPPPGCFPNGFRLRNVNSRKCLDAGNPNFPTPPPRNAPLQQFTCARDTNDRWWVNQTFDFSSPGPPPVVH